MKKPDINSLIKYCDKLIKIYQNSHDDTYSIMTVILKKKYEKLYGKISNKELIDILHWLGFYTYKDMEKMIGKFVDPDDLETVVDEAESANTLYEYSKYNIFDRPYTEGSMPDDIIGVTAKGFLKDLKRKKMILEKKIQLDKNDYNRMSRHNDFAMQSYIHDSRSNKESFDEWADNLGLK